MISANLSTSDTFAYDISGKINEIEEEAIRSALESTGDKTVLIDKLLNVLRLARQVQCTNNQLNSNITQMVSIIEDLNSQIYEKQLEIEQIHSNQSQSTYKEYKEYEEEDEDDKFIESNRIDRMLELNTFGVNSKVNELYQILLDNDKDLNKYRTRLQESFKGMSEEIEELKSQVSKCKIEPSKAIFPNSGMPKNRRSNSVIKGLK